MYGVNKVTGKEYSYMDSLTTSDNLREIKIYLGPVAKLLSQ